jgi:hypothetical protein
MRIFIISLLWMAQFKKGEVAITCSMHGELINCKFTEHFIPGQPERKRLIGRSGRKWDDNVKLDLTELGCKDWIQVAQNRGHMNTMKRLWVP